MSVWDWQNQRDGKRINTAGGILNGEEDLVNLPNSPMTDMTFTHHQDSVSSVRDDAFTVRQHSEPWLLNA